ncbi:MAG: carboxypeptidase-like regulatory domain-containing protein [Gemmatimonadota bacterium]
MNMPVAVGCIGDRGVGERGRHVAICPGGILLLGALAVGVSALHAQVRVEGRLVDAGDDSPVVGAMVALLDDTGELTRTLSNDVGDFLLRAPAAGPFSLLVERIGYRSQVVSVPDPGRPVLVRLPVQPVALPGIDVQVEPVCALAANTSVEILAVWDEIRKALSAAALTAEPPLVFQVRTFERELERDLDPRSLRADTLLVPEGLGFEFADAEQLEANGWTEPAEDGGTRYFAPSPDLLLSSWFTRAHCFELTATETDRLALRFRSGEAAHGVRIEGSFVLDAAAARLSHIAFRFTGDRLLNAEHQGGEIHLGGLPDGRWYVSRWTMRTPEYRRGPLRRTQMGRRLLYQPTTTLSGYFERGGEVLQVVTLTPGRPR